MSHPDLSTVERALIAAQRLSLSGSQTRVLWRMALDADRDTGENCFASLPRLGEAAGFDDKQDRRSTRRVLDHLLAAGALRRDVDAPGIGRLHTVCPVAPWSGRLSPAVLDTTMGRKLAAWLDKQGPVATLATGRQGGDPHQDPHQDPSPGWRHDQGPQTTTASAAAVVAKGRGAGGFVVDLEEARAARAAS